MRMPGFTAEASLDKAGEHYQFAADQADGPTAQTVIPQQQCWITHGCARRCPRRRRRCCRHWNGRRWVTNCRWHVC